MSITVIFLDGGPEQCLLSEYYLLHSLTAHYADPTAGGEKKDNCLSATMELTLNLHYRLNYDLTQLTTADSINMLL